MYLFIVGMRWWRSQRHQTDAVAYIDSIREPVENSAAFMRRSLLVIHAKKSAEMSAADVCACVCTSSPPLLALLSVWSRPVLPGLPHQGRFDYIWRSGRRDSELFLSC